MTTRGSLRRQQANARMAERVARIRKEIDDEREIAIKQEPGWSPSPQCSRTEGQESPLRESLPEAPINPLTLGPLRLRPLAPLYSPTKQRSIGQVYYSLTRLSSRPPSSRPPPSRPPSSRPPPSRPQPRQSPDPPCCNISGRLSFLEKLLVDLGQCVEEVNDRAKEMDARLTSMETSVGLLQQGQAAPPHEPPDDLAFPLTSMEEVDELEGKLKDTHYARKLATYLTTLGGKSSKDITRRIMRKVFSNSLALKFNWTGRGEKRAFSTTKLCRAVILAAKANTHLEVKENDVTAAIKSWLCFAKDRDGGRMRRMIQKARLEIARHEELSESSLSQ